MITGRVIRAKRSEAVSLTAYLRLSDRVSFARIVKNMHDQFKTLRKFDAGKDGEGWLYSLPALEEQGIGKLSRLPVSIRIVLESVLRNCDGKKVRRKTLKRWRNGTRNHPRTRRSHSSLRALFCRTSPAFR